MNEIEEFELRRTILAALPAILEELQAIRAELVALRECAAADRERQARRS